MPATSEKQLKHLEKLNALPQTRANGFQRGHIPYNKGTAIMLDRVCEFCGKPFQIAQSALSRIAHRSGRFCSKECFYNAKKKYGIRAQVMKLYEEGKSYKEIAEEMGKSQSLVAGQVYRMKIKNRFGDAIYNSATRNRVKTLLKNKGIVSCELCGYDRATEIAHIIEQKNGGQYLLNNCLLLCPNCHHLFDYDGLTENEKGKLLTISRLNGNLKERLYVTR